MAKKEKARKPKMAPHKKKAIIKTSIEAFIIVITIAVGMTIPRLYANTTAGDIVERTLGKFFDIGNLILNNYLRIIETLTILLFIWILKKVIGWALVLFLDKKTYNSSPITLLRSIISYFLVLLGIIFVLSAWGVDSSTLLVSLGLIGFAVSFGAQSIIEDLLAGVLIILDNQYQVDDIVYLDGFRGRVLEINLRTTKFLDLGNLDVKYVNNRDVRNVINASQRNSVAICEVGIEYGEDIKRVEEIVNEYLPTMFENHPEILEIPKYLGISSLGDSAVVLKIIAVTKEDNKFQVQRILNREIKLLFDAHQIGIPFPQVTISHLQENDN